MKIVLTLKPKWSFVIPSLLLLLCGCAEKTKKTRVAATATPHAEMLFFVQDDLKREGVDLEVLVVDDYMTPNRSLADKEIDANFFQHAPFLEEQIEQFHYPLISYAKVHIEPMGIYSASLTSLENLPPRAIVALPSDPSNLGRSLLLLEREGLLSLKTKGVASSLYDIKENPYEIRFLEIDAPMLPRSLKDVTFALIPTNFALEAGLSPERDALALEGEDSPYINILVIHKGDEDREDLRALKRALTSPKMAEFLEERYRGEVVPIQNTPQK